jgi:hypothetical protein
MPPITLRLRAQTFQAKLDGHRPKRVLVKVIGE